MTLDKTRGTAR